VRTLPQWGRLEPIALAVEDLRAESWVGRECLTRGPVTVASRRRRYGVQATASSVSGARGRIISAPQLHRAWRRPSCTAVVTSPQG
jgi:hypothetical protein